MTAENSERILLLRDEFTEKSQALMAKEIEQNIFIVNDAVIPVPA